MRDARKTADAVTREMVKAGAQVLKEFSGYSFDQEYRARLVYLAMSEARDGATIGAADHLSA